MTLSKEILDRFNEALEAARQAGEPEPTAMILATADARGGLSTRAVLLKAIDQRGLVFYTNTLSLKGRQLRENPRASVTFLWKSTLCQVHAAGTASLVADDEADAYFATRDRASQLGAWASLQSQLLESRALLERRVREFERKFEGREVPRPPHWSGYRLAPEVVEFWHGRRFRLHDRFCYRVSADEWILERLYP